MSAAAAAKKVKAGMELVKRLAGKEQKLSLTDERREKEKEKRCLFSLLSIL
jgi:hypothetical protein